MSMPSSHFSKMGKGHPKKGINAVSARPGHVNSSTFSKAIQKKKQAAILERRRAKEQYVMANNDVKMMGTKPQKPNEEENQTMAGVEWQTDEDEDHIMGDTGLPPNEEEDLDMETDAKRMELEWHRKNEQVEQVNMEGDER